MVAFTQLFTVVALAVAHTAIATSCSQATSFGIDYAGSDPATLASYGVEFVDQSPCAADAYASYKDLGVQYGDSYVWAQEASARAEVKYTIRETQIVAPVKSAPVVPKAKCDSGCLQRCIDTMGCGL
ncbi:hypothetical protein RhiJN_18111 [Ceratobasidium sp. AG-Ba]|nr:hypothetical protein RhiJN_18111 [Ceratobasidium sp. AG-Ba]